MRTGRRERPLLGIVEKVLGHATAGPKRPDGDPQHDAGNGVTNMINPTVSPPRPDAHAIRLRWQEKRKSVLTNACGDVVAKGGPRVPQGGGGRDLGDAYTASLGCRDRGGGGSLQAWSDRHRPRRDKILELRAQEDEPDALGLRVEVTGVQGVEYTYDLTFDPVAEADPAVGDVIETQGDLPVIVPADSIDALRGATLDLPTTNGQQGLVLRNPNRPDPLGGAHIELSGTVEDKVRQLLEGQINPSLAMHGGFATLDRVDEDKVTSPGGGPGCAGPP